MADDSESTDLQSFIVDELALYPIFPPFRNAPSEELRKLTVSSIEKHLDFIERTAAKLLGHQLTGADVKRWVAIQHHVCAQTLKAPAPKSLLELTTLLLNVSPRPRCHVKNLEMYNRAMDYVIDHPDATPDQVKRGIKYDQRSVIAKWMKDPEFRRSVDLHRGWKSEQG